MTDFATWIGLLLGILLGLIAAAVWIGAIVDAARHPRLSQRGVWLTVIVLLSVFGAIAYGLFGRPASKT